MKIVRLEIFDYEDCLTVRSVMFTAKIVAEVQRLPRMQTRTDAASSIAAGPVDYD